MDDTSAPAASLMATISALSPNVFILLVEEWESKAHQEAYLEWRVSTGLLDAIAPLVSADPLFRSYEIRSE